MGLLLNGSISQSFLLSSFPESRLACFCRENIDRRWLSRFFFTSVGLEQISMEEKLWSKKKNVSHRHSSILPGNQFGLQTKHCSYIYHLSVILDPQASKITERWLISDQVKSNILGNVTQMAGTWQTTCFPLHFYFLCTGRVCTLH